MLSNPRPTEANTDRISSVGGERLMVALSFDDGYLDHYKMARLLNTRGIKATFFLITGLTRWNNKPLLTLRPKLIRRMRRMNHEVASHTQSHPNLRRITDEQVRDELRGSKEYLENLLEEPVEGFAYPYGKYDKRVSRLTSNYYGYARTARELENPNRYELPIRSPGLSLRMCSLRMTKNMIRGGGFAIIVLHSTNTLSLRVWIEYMRMFRVRFVTLSELVDAQYGFTQYPNKIGLV
jgi:peptidoglycan/xylan/chitin deacetylase (PgdA/CDA1 family)